MTEYEPVPNHVRRSMLREIITHEEAQLRESWAQTPLEPGDHATSYAEMMLDPTVAYCVGLIQEAIVSAGHAVVPKGRTRQQLVVAAAIEADLAALPMHDILHDALDATWRGFRLHEIEWDYRGGIHHLCDLAAVDPDQIALNVDDKMRATSVVSKPVGFPSQTLPLEKVWLHRNRPSRTRPAGESILEPAYRPWKSKDRLLQFWGMSIQRFGMTSIKATVPTNTTAARQQQILSILYQGRLDGVYLVPEDILVDALQPSPWANLTFEKSIDYQDAQMAMAILFTYQPGGSAVGQTYVTGAGLSEQARATSIRLQRISSSLAYSFTDQVIRPLVYSNFGPKPELVPDLRIGKPDAGRIATLAVPLSQVVAAGIMDRAVAAEQLDTPEPIDPMPMGLQDNALTVSAKGSARPQAPAAPAARATTAIP